MQMLKCKNTGQISMMRVGMLVSLIVGAFISIAGALNLDAQHAGNAMISGAGLISAITCAKAYQSRCENANNTKSD